MSAKEWSHAQSENFICLIYFLVLQALCEKGLVAMENSHRRIIAELEEKHRQEIEQLRHKKDKHWRRKHKRHLQVQKTAQMCNMFCLANIYFCMRFFKTLLWNRQVGTYLFHMSASEYNMVYPHCAGNTCECDWLLSV